MCVCAAIESGEDTGGGGFRGRTTHCTRAPEACRGISTATLAARGRGCHTVTFSINVPYRQNGLRRQFSVS